MANANETRLSRLANANATFNVTMLTLLLIRSRIQLCDSTFTKSDTIVQKCNFYVIFLRLRMFRRRPDESDIFYGFTKTS